LFSFSSANVFSLTLFNFCYFWSSSESWEITSLNRSSSSFAFYCYSFRISTRSSFFCNFFIVPNLFSFCYRDISFPKMPVLSGSSVPGAVPPSIFGIKWDGRGCIAGGIFLPFLSNLTLLNLSFFYYLFYANAKFSRFLFIDSRATIISGFLFFSS
jgi:hypothetical protein